MPIKNKTNSSNGGTVISVRGGELGSGDFVAIFLAEAAFHFFLRDRNGDGDGFVRIGEAAEDVVGGGGGEFGAAGGGKGDLHVGERDGVVTVIRDNEEDGKEIVGFEVQ